MKKKYIICFFALTAAVCAGFGYYKAYGTPQLNNEEKSYIREDVSVMAAEPVTNKETQMILETYDEVAQTSEKEASALPAIYIGMTKVQLLEALNRYMQDLSIEETEKGLVNFELMYFSNDYVILRKIYHPSKEFYKYYIKYSGGCITVFYCDYKTVYEYTDIQLSQLPSHIQSQVISGKRIRDEKELFDFLENYSS